jgi:hypothetical protein
VRGGQEWAMKPSELLREVKRRLLADEASLTWNRSGGFYCGDTACIRGHLSNVVRERRLQDWYGGADWESAYRILVESIPEKKRRADLGEPIAIFNDRTARSLWDVVAMLGRAVRRLEAEGR